MHQLRQCGRENNRGCATGTGRPNALLQLHGEDTGAPFGYQQRDDEGAAGVRRTGNFTRRLRPKRRGGCIVCVPLDRRQVR